MTEWEGEKNRKLELEEEYVGEAQEHGDKLTKEPIFFIKNNYYLSFTIVPCLKVKKI